MNSGVLKLAIEEAEKSDHPIYKMGSVIFKGSRIISSGRNQFRSSNIPCKYKRRQHTLHAEQDAVRGVDWDKLNGTSVLVVRLNTSGKFSLAFPCKYCLETLKYVRMKWVYYTTRTGEIKRDKI